MQIVYYLSREGLLEQPHLLEMPAMPYPNEGLYLKDVKKRLMLIRGKTMPASFSWSYKRIYKNDYVWQDVSDEDLIFPAQGGEYTLKGSKTADASQERWATRLDAHQHMMAKQDQTMLSTDHFDGDDIGAGSVSANCDQIERLSAVNDQDANIGEDCCSLTFSESQKSDIIYDVEQIHVDLNPISSSCVVDQQHTIVNPPTRQSSLAAKDHPIHKQKGVSCELKEEIECNAELMYRKPELPAAMVERNCRGVDDNFINTEKDDELVEKVEISPPTCNNSSSSRNSEADKGEEIISPPTVILSNEKDSQLVGKNMHEPNIIISYGANANRTNGLTVHNSMPRISFKETTHEPNFNYTVYNGARDITNEKIMPKRVKTRPIRSLTNESTKPTSRFKSKKATSNSGFLQLGSCKANYSDAIGAEESTYSRNPNKIAGHMQDGKKSKWRCNSYTPVLPSHVKVSNLSDRISNCKPDAPSTINNIDLMLQEITKVGISHAIIGSATNMKREGYSDQLGVELPDTMATMSNIIVAGRRSSFSHSQDHRSDLVEAISYNQPVRKSTSLRIQNHHRKTLPVFGSQRKWGLAENELNVDLTASNNYKGATAQQYHGSVQRLDNVEPDLGHSRNSYGAGSANNDRDQRITVNTQLLWDELLQTTQHAFKKRITRSKQREE